MKEIEIDNFNKQIDDKKRYKFFISPNYEDRSVGFLEEILKLDKRNFEVIVMKLQSHNYKIDILDDLKINLFYDSLAKLEKAEVDYKEVDIPYPDRYTSMTIEHLRDDNITGDDHVIFDVSCLPKTVVVDICQVFLEKNACASFSLAYSSPLDYPKIRYPQAIGEMKGIINHQPINKLLERYKRGTLITFPSDLGYSGQLIADQVAKYSDFEQYLFVYMRRRQPMHSYDAIAGNSNLLSEAYKQWRNNVVNHFSIQDGFRKLKEVVDNIKSRVPKDDREDYLVLFAPFGPKPLIVGCYLLVKELKKVKIDAEIVQESSFQYSSVYSIGKQKTYLFKIEK